MEPVYFRDAMYLVAEVEVMVEVMVVCVGDVFCRRAVFGGGVIFCRGDI